MAFSHRVLGRHFRRRVVLRGGGGGIAAFAPGWGSPVEELRYHGCPTRGAFSSAGFRGRQPHARSSPGHPRGTRGPARMHGRVGDVELSAASASSRPRARRTSGPVGPLRRGVAAGLGARDRSDLIGLFRHRTHAGDSEVTLVLPRFAALTERVHARELEASVTAPRSGSGNELFGVREYRPGDPLRRIHWRSSAAPRRAHRARVRTAGRADGGHPVRSGPALARSRRPGRPPRRVGGVGLPARRRPGWSCGRRGARPPAPKNRARSGLCSSGWPAIPRPRTREGSFPCSCQTRSPSRPHRAPASPTRWTPSGGAEDRSARGWWGRPSSRPTRPCRGRG